MSDRIDQLSDRAQWFLQNFDEIDLADICASHEKSAKATEAALNQLRALAGRWQTTVRPGEQHPAAAAILNIIDGGRAGTRGAAACEHSFPDAYPAPIDQPGDCRYCGTSYQAAKRDHDGPSVREAADNDRRWPLEKAGE